MENTKIEWATNTFNPWIGCTKVSAGCKNCYAEQDMDKRRGRVEWGINGTRSVTSCSYWRQPLKWNREAERTGIRPRVFCASLADVFEDWKGQVCDSNNNPLWWPEWGNIDADNMPLFAANTLKKEGAVRLTLSIIRAYLFSLIERTPNLDWLLLTKRPENIFNLADPLWLKDGFPANVWMGTTCENQEEANKRIPYLLEIPAKVRFLSCEPLLSDIDLNMSYGNANGDAWVYPLTGYYHCEGMNEPCLSDNKISWVIVGGESGHNARPMHPDWALNIINQCEKFNIPVLFKQWGEYLPECMYKGVAHEILENKVRVPFPSPHNHDKTNYYYRLGKKAAGRIINGRTYDGLPVITQK